jgi:hypothetical protein
MQTQRLGSWGRAAQLQNSMALAAMFDRPLEQLEPGGLYVPSKAYLEHEIAAADIDADGQEDEYAIRLMPLTDATGIVMAAGATGEISFEPLRWVQVLNFMVEPTLAADLLVTNFVIGQDPQFPSKGVVPANVFASNATNGLIDVPWCGPGVPLELSLKNIHASASRTFFGAARVRALINNKMK